MKNKDLTETFGRQEGILNRESEMFDFVNFSDFIDIVSRNNAADRVEKVNYEIGDVNMVQVYVELNRKYIYSSTIIKNEN